MRQQTVYKRCYRKLKIKMDLKEHVTVLLENTRDSEYGRSRCGRFVPRAGHPVVFGYATRILPHAAPVNARVLQHPRALSCAAGGGASVVDEQSLRAFYSHALHLLPAQSQNKCCMKYLDLLSFLLTLCFSAPWSPGGICNWYTFHGYCWGTLACEPG